MNLKEFIDTTNPESLQKLAETAQNELVGKFVEALLPLMEKQAEYAAYLILEKLAEQIDETRVDGETAAKQNVDISETPVETTAGKDNSLVQDGNNNIGGLPAQQVKDAITEAIEVNQTDKIIPFAKQLAQQYPDAFKEVVKMIKVALQDGVLKKFIDVEQAANISDQINAMIGE